MIILQRAVVALISAAVILSACAGDDGREDDPGAVIESPASTAPAPAPTTTAATTVAPTTSGIAQSLTDDEALAISDAYIEAFNSGDKSSLFRDPRLSSGLSPH